MDRGFSWNNVSREDLLNYLQVSTNCTKQSNNDHGYILKLWIQRVAEFTEENHRHPNSDALQQNTRLLIMQLRDDLELLDDGQQGIDHHGYEGIDEGL